MHKVQYTDYQDDSDVTIWCKKDTLTRVEVNTHEENRPGLVSVELNWSDHREICFDAHDEPLLWDDLDNLVDGGE